MTEEKFEELEQLILTCAKEVLISNNKILIQLNMLQSSQKANKEEIKKAAEKNADKIISQIINRIGSDSGMTEAEYKQQTGDSIEETENARIEAENDTKLSDISEEDLYAGDDE